MEAVAVNLSMRGKICTKEKCPCCGGRFSGAPLSCPSCRTTPKRYRIRLYVKGTGEVVLYSDRQGRPLCSYEHAERVLTGIRYETDQKVFDSTKYVRSDMERFRFDSLIEAWYQDKKSEQDKGNRAKGYVRILRTYIDNYYLDFFKGHDVREIRTHHIKDFYRRLPKKSLKYIKNIMSALQNFFNTLAEDDLIERPPVFPGIELEKKLPKWVDFHAQIKIIRTLPKEDKPIFLFLAWQGVRPGEARALKVKDVDLRNESIHIRRTLSDNEIKERTKGRNEKIRAINPMLLGLLRRLCADKHPESFVFINPRTGGPYYETAFRRSWHTNSKGIDITPYQATRHSLASQLLESDVHLNVIKDILGHTDIRTTLKYAHGDMKNQKMGFRKHQAAKIIRIQPQTRSSTKP